MLSYVYVVLAALLWSFNPAVIQRFGRGLGAITITVFRAAAALILLAPLAILKNAQNFLNTYAILLAVASAVVGPAIGDAAYAKAIQLAGGSLAVIVSYTYMFVAQAFATLLGEVIGIATGVGSALAFLGIVIALSGKDFGKAKLRGILYAAIASISWGIGSAIIKPVTALADPLVIAVIRLATVLTTLLPIAIAFERKGLENGYWNLAIVSVTTGVLGWGIGMYLFLYSIALIGVSKTVLATALTPVLSQLIIRLITKDKVRLRNIAGAILVATGIAISAHQPT